MPRHIRTLELPQKDGNIVESLHRIVSDILLDTGSRLPEADFGWVAGFGRRHCPLGSVFF